MRCVDEGHDEHRSDGVVDQSDVAIQNVVVVASDSADDKLAVDASPVVGVVVCTGRVDEWWLCIACVCCDCVKHA